MKSKIARIAFAIGTLSLAVPCAAQAASYITVTQTVAAVDPLYDQTVLRSESTPPRIGERLRYNVVAHNDGDRYGMVIASEKIKPGQRFVAGSAGMRAEYSTDGGLTWTRDHVPATKVTAIRWTPAKTLAPGAHATFGYEVTVAST
jgi:hypothetical protein